MSNFHKTSAALGILGLFIVLGLSASPGLFTIDEFVLFAGADAMARGHGFFVQNGTSDLQSGQLRLWILILGENGYTPQYPAGSAIVGAPLLALLGTKGVMLANAVAALAAVFVLYRMTCRHFGGQSAAVVACLLLLFCSFFLEYAFAVWPHTVEMLAVLVAASLALDIIHAQKPQAWHCVLAGIALGLGLHFRLSVVLAGAAIGIGIFLLHARPVRPLLLIGLGFLPFGIAASLINWAKFGTLNPATYGQSNGGGTSLSAHLVMLVALLLLTLGAFVFKRMLDDERYRRKLTVGSALAVLVTLAVGYQFAGAYLHGFWALVVDAKALADPRSGVVALDNGTQLFWGFWKKALGQSLPWMALALPALIGSRYLTGRTRVTLLLLFLVWSLPFFPKDWHGGLGSNMRYLLPLVPIFCASAAPILVDLWQRAQQPRVWVLSGLFTGFVILVAWSAYMPSAQGGAHQVLPTWVLLGTAALSLAWHWSDKPRSLSQGLLVAGSVSAALASALALQDYRNAQITRQDAVEYSRAHLGLPDRAVVYVPSRYLMGWALREDHFSALPHEQSGKIDMTLVERALAQGYRVFIWPQYINEQLESDARFGLVLTDIGKEEAKLFEIVSSTPGQP